jgi:senataxin
MPHYRKLLDSLTKFVEKHNTDSSNLEKYIILQNIASAKAVGEETHFDQLEGHVLNSSHIVLTTLGSAGSRIVEEAQKFAVVVVDEAAQWYVLMFSMLPFTCLVLWCQRSATSTHVLSLSLSLS